jgi:hypothetical protein
MPSVGKPTILAKKKGPDLAVGPMKFGRGCLKGLILMAEGPARLKRLKCKGCCETCKHVGKVRY